MKLWYKQPAKHWPEALPLGNGRIGAMVFSGVENDKLSLNEDSLWSGYPKDTNLNTKGCWQKAAEMVNAGKLHEAQYFVEETMQSNFTQAYQPLGDLMLNFKHGAAEVKSYERGLSLDDAVSYVSYEINGVSYRRECFISHPAQSMIMKITASEKGKINFDASLTSQLKYNAKANDNRIYMETLCPSYSAPNYQSCENPIAYSEKDEEKGISALTIIDIELANGNIKNDGRSISIENADEVIIRLCVRSSFNGFDKHPFLEGADYEKSCREDIEKACEIPYQKMLEQHKADYCPIFERCSFKLQNVQHENMPTDERLENFAKNQNDEELYELFFQYGRYLTIAASRPGTQAMNLQGIWNSEMRAPWSSNYTININTQMNYWPAEICNLSEMHSPLFELIKNLTVNGKKTAEKMYGARGAVSHHNSDIWAQSTPVGEDFHGSAQWSMWPLSYGWLSEHTITHYIYTGDKGFLRETAYPALEAASRFFLDILTDTGNGEFAFSPSTSPENSFYHEGKPAFMVKSAAMTDAIVRESIENFLYAAKILGIENEQVKECSEMLPKLKPFKIGHDGRLMEWDSEYPEAEPHHRHVSHLYALHPANLISTDKTPQLANACKRTLEARGDDGTGWSLGWKINFWARLNDGDRALKLLNMQLEKCDADSDNGRTYINLFDAHPPFQIDGNFGAIAGIAEMFVQNRKEDVRILPALPSKWQNGEIKGLKTSGGYTADIIFENGALKKVIFTASEKNSFPITVFYGSKKYMLNLKNGESIVLESKDFYI